MDLTGYEKMMACRGKPPLRKGNRLISISQSGHVGFGIELARDYNLNDKERVDIFVQKTDKGYFNIALGFCKSGQYKITKSEYPCVSAKALAQKYPGICGKYQLVGAENSPEGLFFLCEQISRI